MHVDWLAGRLLPVFQPPRELRVYNVHNLPYDLQLGIATLVGLLNRAQASIYLDWREFDLFWLREALAHIPTTLSSLRGEAILYELLDQQRERLAGCVLYDPACLDSVNVATMLGAQNNGIVVSPTLAARLSERGYRLPVLADLRVHRWRSRAQVYRWALQHLLHHTTPGLLAGLGPKTALGLRPYLVAANAFIYWLHPLAFTPNKGQAERELLKTILRACPEGTVHLGWFLQEGSGVTLTSQHAIPVVASDYFSNLETWSAVAPVQSFTTSVHSAPLPALQNKVYVSFTMSEGDNLQYIQEPMLRHWQHAQRGSIPLGWPVALILPQAAPALWDYYQRTASVNDEFIAAPSGLGYCYPSKWPRARLADYLRQTGQSMQEMHLDLLEVLESNFWSSPRLMHRALTSGAGMALVDPRLQRRLASELSAFGLRGILSGGGQTRGSCTYHEHVPVLQNVGIASSIEQTLNLVRRATSKRRPDFLNVYVLAWKMGPGELQEVAQRLGNAYEIVTPGTLLRLKQTYDANRA